MSLATDTRKLKIIVKESMKEVLVLEFMKFRADLLRCVSEREQGEIEKIYGKPMVLVVKSVNVGV